jgi:hypothetical protein
MESIYPQIGNRQNLRACEYGVRELGAEGEAGVDASLVTWPLTLQLYLGSRWSLKR